MDNSDTDYTQPDPILDLIITLWGGRLLITAVAVTFCLFGLLFGVVTPDKHRLTSSFYVLSTIFDRAHFDKMLVPIVTAQARDHTSPDQNHLKGIEYFPNSGRLVAYSDDVALGQKQLEGVSEKLLNKLLLQLAGDIEGLEEVRKSSKQYSQAVNLEIFKLRAFLNRAERDPEMFGFSKPLNQNVSIKIVHLGLGAALIGLIFGCFWLLLRESIDRHQGRRTRL